MLKLIFRNRPKVTKKPFKLLVAAFFSFLLVVPSFLNIVAFVLPVSAAPKTALVATRVNNQVHTISDGGRLDVSGSNVNVVNEVDINTRNSRNNQVNPTIVRVVPNPPKPQPPKPILDQYGNPLPPSKP